MQDIKEAKATEKLRKSEAKDAERMQNWKISG